MNMILISLLIGFISCQAVVQVSGVVDTEDSSKCHLTFKETSSAATTYTNSEYTTASIIVSTAAAPQHGDKGVMVVIGLSGAGVAQSATCDYVQCIGGCTTFGNAGVGITGSVTTAGTNTGGWTATCLVNTTLFAQALTAVDTVGTALYTGIDNGSGAAFDLNHVPGTGTQATFATTCGSGNNDAFGPLLSLSTILGIAIFY